VTIRTSLRRVLLGILVALSAGLVVGAFNPAPHSGGDNAGYVALAHALAGGEGYVDAFDPLRAPHTKYPPLFPLLLAGLIGLGATTWTALKSISAVATVAGVAATFLWTERRLGPWAAFATGVVFSASAGTVYHSHWVLSDAVFVLLAMVSLWALERAEARSWDRRWIALGVVSALCSYFTRSAGLPLLVAILTWLALRRRFKTVGAVALAFGAPALLWWLRGRGAGVGDYAIEFWLVDPYQPGLGTIGVGGLLGRGLENAVAYATRHLPAAVLGASGGWATGFGLTLLSLAVVGWGARVRRAPHAADLFVPLYAGLVLVWPAVWGGDRFVLPLLPMVLAYAAWTLERATRRLGGGGSMVAAGAMLALLLPSLGTWVGSVRDARACAAIVSVGGPFACYSSGVLEFVDAAAWMGSSLPDGSAVMTRKPRIFHVMSGGVPSRTFPFDAAPDVHLAEADAVGARYVLLDRWDVQAARFVGAAVRQMPGAFCFVRGFGPGPAGASQLLGILPEEARMRGSLDAEGGVSLARCPAGYLRAGVDPDAPYASSTSTRIPLLSSSSAP
jgi:hypothetical protein